MVSSVKWVDEVIKDSPYAINEEFMNKLFTEYGIDYIIHGDDPCLLPDGSDAYAHAKKAGRFKQIKRTEGVSSTDIVGKDFSQTIVTSIAKSSYLLAISVSLLYPPIIWSSPPLSEFHNNISRYDFSQEGCFCACGRGPFQRFQTMHPFSGSSAMGQGKVKTVELCRLELAFHISFQHLDGLCSFRMGRSAAMWILI